MLGRCPNIYDNYEGGASWWPSRDRVVKWHISLTESTSSRTKCYNPLMSLSMYKQKGCHAAVAKNFVIQHLTELHNIKRKRIRSTYRRSIKFSTLRDDRWRRYPCHWATYLRSKVWIFLSIVDTIITKRFWLKVKIQSYNSLDRNRNSLPLQQLSWPALSLCRDNVVRVEQ